MFECRCKYDHVIDDKGYQYCVKCGKAIKAPCVHKWEIKNTYSSVDKSFGIEHTNYISYILVCTKCGTIGEKKVMKVFGND